MKYSISKDNDWLLIVVTALLSIFGLIMVFSSSYVWALYQTGDFYFFIKRQSMWFFMGIFVFFIVMHIPFQLYRKLSAVIILGSIIILTAVLLFGHEVYGAQRWLRIGPFQIQPSEFVKLGMIMYLASVYSKKQAYIDQFIKGVMPPLIVVTIVLALIVRQPDLGTATSILLVTILIVFFSGAKIKHLILLGMSGFAVFVIAVFAAPYRMKRITSYLDPFADAAGDGYQILQSYIAIAHGGLSGAGLGQSVQKLMYLPEPQTDFILAIISEELGLLGVLFVFACYTIIFFKGVMAGIRCKNPFGSLLAFGIVFQIGIQIVFNVGAVSGLLPITGIPLPFISNGGSSLLVSMISVAVLANIARQNRQQRRLAEESDERLGA